MCKSKVKKVLKKNKIKINSKPDKMIKESKSFKRWCFNTRLTQLVQEHYPADKDFTGYQTHIIHKPIKTHTNQKSPSELGRSIGIFHAKALQEGKRGTY